MRCAIVSLQMHSKLYFVSHKWAGGHVTIVSQIPLKCDTSVKGPVVPVKVFLKVIVNYQLLP